MQIVYEFDVTTGVPTGVTELTADQQIDPSYQTTVVPPENKSVKFDTENKKWVEFTPEIDPVTAQLAELIKNNASQTALNAQLIKQIAALRAVSAAKTNTTQGA